MCFLKRLVMQSFNLLLGWVDNNPAARKSVDISVESTSFLEKDAVYPCHSVPTFMMTRYVDFLCELLVGALCFFSSANFFNLKFFVVFTHRPDIQLIR